MDKVENVSRVRWHCRRGMLELDAMLLPFVDAVYPTLSATQQATFVRLLEAQDPDLFAWLMGRTQPDDEVLVAMIARIRAYRR